MFKRGHNKLRKEIEITNMIKTLRILKSATKRNFSKIQWRIYKLQKGTRRLHLDENADKYNEQKVFKEFVVTPIVKIEKEIKSNEETRTNISAIGKDDELEDKYSS